MFISVWHSVATVLFVLCAWLRGNRWHPQWLTVAKWNLWIGFGLTLLTLLFGWLAFNTAAHDDVAHEPMTEHATLAIFTAGAFAGLVLWSARNHRVARQPSLLFAIYAVGCLVLLLLTGLRGGELVYRYGVAVTPLNAAPSANNPPTGGHVHRHSDGTEHRH